MPLRLQRDVTTLNKLNRTDFIQYTQIESYINFYKKLVRDLLEERLFNDLLVVTHDIIQYFVLNLFFSQLCGHI